MHQMWYSNCYKAGSTIHSDLKKSRRTRKKRTESEMSLCSNGSEDSGCSNSSGFEGTLSDRNSEKGEHRKGMLLIQNIV